MNIIFNLLISLIHFVFAYGLFITILISTNVNILFFCLIILVLTKISFNIFKRCILTLFEKNEYFATTAKLLSSTICDSNLKEPEMEMILINIGILIVLNKISVIIILKYYTNWLKYIA